MQKIRLGRTGLMVTKTAMGCLPVQRCNDEAAIELLRAAYDGGINYFDTANAYSDSEKKIGLALSDVRDKIIISTKSAARDKETVLKHIENSLRMMKTDYIDLFQFHNPAELPDPEGICDKYPHELSGGMLQRAMIAAAIVNRPKLLLLDEPTTALDVTIQAQILEMLKKLNRESGVSMLFISHNLNVVRKLCRRVAVMQRGVLVEEGDTDQVFYHPQHPYTQKLIDAIPTRNRKEERP